MTILKERHTRDEKTIRELAAEVKRLTTILSRQKIEEDESVRTGASDLSSSTAPTSSPTLTTEDNLQTSTSTSTANEKEVKPLSSQPLKTVYAGYSLLFVICAFLVGVLMVLVPLTIRHPEVSLL